MRSQIDSLCTDSLSHSTGGIIALGFGHHGWTVDQCIQTFQELVDPVYTKRKLQGLHSVRYVQLFVKHSKYETAPLERALKVAFDAKTRLFPANISHGRLKTAVTAVSSSGSNAWVLSNYATLPGQEGRGPRYKCYRPNRPQDELRTWEAARSTSAAPGFFKPFALSRQDARLEEWIDGALLHNNPAEIALEEARRIAETESLNNVPDVVLSIGTGLTKQKGKLGEIAEKIPPQPKFNTWLKNLFTMVNFQIKLNLDADRRWDQIVESDKEFAKHMYRVNPDLKMDPPQLDDVSKVPMLAKMVPELLAKDWVTDQKIRQISAALMGSLFYFERGGSPINISSLSTELEGWIRCRLNGPALGQVAKFFSLSSRPEFIIHNSHKDGDDIHIPVPMSKFESNTFVGVHTKLTISSDDVSTTMALRLPGICNGKSEFLISGFPRKLLKLDFGPG